MNVDAFLMQHGRKEFLLAARPVGELYMPGLGLVLALILAMVSDG